MNKLYGGIEAGGTKFLCMVGSSPEQIVAEERFPTTSPQETISPRSSSSTLTPTAASWERSASVPLVPWISIPIRPRMALSPPLQNLVGARWTCAGNSSGHWACRWQWIPMSTPRHMASIIGAKTAPHTTLFVRDGWHWHRARRDRRWPAAAWIDPPGRWASLYTPLR